MGIFFGKNDLGAKQMFEERNLYDGFVLSELKQVKDATLETVQIKDFLKNEKMLVGRIDQLGNSIIIDPARLSSFATEIGGSNVSAANFVVQAFKDMKIKFDDDLRKGKISADSVALGDLEVKRGFVDPRQLYSELQIKKKQEFMSYVTSNNLLNKIVDFESFVKIYMSFAEMTAADEPFTQTMHLLTTDNSVLSSGLAFEIYEGNYDDDEIKAELFYKDPNFEYLKNLAYSHGFVIDKHIPWRFVADLESPNMLPYIEAELVLAGGLAVLFLMYTRSSFEDLNNMSSMMIDTYNTIANSRPVSRVKEPSATASLRSTQSVFAKCKKRKTIVRRTISVEQAAKFPNSYWIDKYVKIRKLETGLDYSDAAINQIIRNATQLINSIDIFTSLRYINDKFNSVEHYEGSMFHDFTRLQMSQEPRDPNVSVEDSVQQSVQASNFVVY